MGTEGQSLGNKGEAERAGVRKHLSSQNPGCHLTWTTAVEHGATRFQERYKTKLSGLWGYKL